MTSRSSKSRRVLHFVCATLLLSISNQSFAGPLNGYSWVGAPVVVKTSTARHEGDNGASCGSDFEMCIGQASKVSGETVELKTIKCFIPKNTVTCPTNEQLDTLTGERRCVFASEMTRESSNACRESGGPSGPCFCREFNQQKDSSRECYNALASYRRSHNCSKVGQANATAEDVSRCRWACSGSHASTSGNCARLQCAENETRQQGGYSQYCSMATWRNAASTADCTSHFASSAPYWNSSLHQCTNETASSPGRTCPGRTLQVGGVGPCVNYETYCRDVGVGPGTGKRYCSSNDTCYMVPPRNESNPSNCVFGSYGTPCGFPIDCYHPLTRN